MEVKHVKVLAFDQDGSAESMWASPVGNHEYQIDSIPFVSYNVSYRDVVSAEKQGDVLRIRSVVRKSGYRTLWSDFEPLGGLAGELCKEFRDKMTALGCLCEGFLKKYLAIAVPPEVDIDAITQRLDEVDVVWNFGDPRPDVETEYVPSQG